MPTITFSYNDLCKLVGKDLPKDKEKLQKDLLVVKSEVESFEEDELKLEIKDSNRPDIFSVEGISHILKGFYGIEKGLRDYNLKSSKHEVIIDPSVVGIRPYIVAGVIKNVVFDDSIIRNLMDLEEKLHETYGRKRKKVAIGLYELDKITSPIYYTTTKPDENKFVPLWSNAEIIEKLKKLDKIDTEKYDKLKEEKCDDDEILKQLSKRQPEFGEIIQKFTEKEYTPKEILSEHPKGGKFRDIINHFNRYPILLDKNNNVLSMPPIINSATVGRITPDTKNIFIEATGTDFSAISLALNIITTVLFDRGGKIESVKLLYPSNLEVESNITPDFSSDKMMLDANYSKKILGIDLSTNQIVDLLLRSRFGAEANGDKIKVDIPPIRPDVLHQVDIIEDIAIMYGYGEIKPEMPKIFTVGALDTIEEKYDGVRDLLIGLNFTEIMTFILTNPDNLFNKMQFNKMQLPSRDVVEISNPKSKLYTCFRSWLLPSLMEFLSKNTNVSYPQKIFEVGDVVEVALSEETRTRTIKKVALAMSDSKVNFTQMKSIVKSILYNIGICEYQINEIEHPLFILGRGASIKTIKGEVGIFGEVHPKILKNWNLVSPTVVSEINVELWLRDQIKESQS